MRLWDFQTTHDLVERLLDKVCHVLKSTVWQIAGRAVTRSDTA